MPNKGLPPEVKKAIKKDLDNEVPYSKIAAKHKVSYGAINNVKNGIGTNQADERLRKSQMVLTDNLDEVAARLLRKQPHTVVSLADALDCAPRRAQDILERMREKGMMLLEQKDTISISQGAHLDRGQIVLPSTKFERHYGVTGDTHLCNRNARLDVLQSFYDECERRGITDVFHTGNWVDGECRFNKGELIVRPGLEAQCDYMIDVWPVKKGITTHYVAGDDHEGWWQQREGIEIGRHLQMRAEKAGRHDLKYLGYGECDVKLEVKGGAYCTMRVLHPGGGASYATSYAAQKIVESYQGGEKPQILLIGHYHKFEYGYPREVHCLQTACMTDQSLFMRKHKIQAHVGYNIIHIGQGAQGQVTRFGLEWFPFFDRKCYTQQYR